MDYQRVRTELFKALIAVQDAHAYMQHVEQMMRDAGHDHQAQMCASVRRDLLSLHDTVKAALEVWGDD